MGAAVGQGRDGEGIEQALLREVDEETGLRIDAVEKYLGHFDYTSGSGALTRQLTFEVTVTRTGPVTLTEHDAHEWPGPTRSQPPTTPYGNSSPADRAQ
ncbi:NUDIX domain-containing protein [Kitasatospora sp. NPDC097691]|uniref:NUDIX hydrolase n=1 Tax=Kitasatospora sp. NPDC097691 TaxID=3157231 RepID=UPI0033290552